MADSIRIDAELLIRRAIASLAFLGGVVGIGLTLFWARLFFVHWQTTSIAVFFVALMGWGMRSGVLLWQEPTLPERWNLSALFQGPVEVGGVPGPSPSDRGRRGRT